MRSSSKKVRPGPKPEHAILPPHFHIERREVGNMSDVVIGTTSGVYRLDGDRATFLGLKGERIWAIHAFNDTNGTVILAGSYGNGIFRSTDNGETWNSANDGLTATALRTIQPDPDGSGAIICGCEPGRGFRSTDGGQSWTEMSGIVDLPRVEEWYLPYSPRAGALRNFYSPQGQPQRLLASVEVGGLLNSNDAGETWEVLDTAPDDDIHFVTGDPNNPDLLYAALGWASLERGRRREDAPPLGGIGRSRDGGKTWEKLFDDYTRAVIVPPAEQNLLLAGPAKRVGAQGRIEVSSDQGDTWDDASGGITTPMEDMVELFVPAPDGDIWAICSGGRLLKATPGEWKWAPALRDGDDLTIQSVAFVSAG
jgi:photosystem II stability/assembly factor-like uncharacterized protein